ncbi:MAG: sensor domain-containing diguanylate cyclase, partial [bacterium]
HSVNIINNLWWLKMADFTATYVFEKGIDLLAEQGLDMVFITDQEGEIKWVNRRFEKVTGYSAKEAVGENPRLLNSGYQPETFYENLWNTIKAGERWRGTFCNQKKDGNLFWTDSVIIPVNDDNGEIVAFASAHQDVTDSYRLRERLQATVQSSLTGIMTITEAGIVENVNPSASETFGYRPREIIGKSVEQIFPAADFIEGLESFVEEGDLRIIGRRMEKQARRADGSTFPAQVELNDIQTAEGIKFICMVIDVSAQVEYRQKLEEANEKLAEKNKYLERLTIIDPLTEIPNRRRFEEKLNEEWERCQRESQPLGVIILDIDDFKDYNDHYGHPAGDRCLKQVAGILKDEIKRSIDIVARYGGEEFAAILPDTALEDCSQLAENICRAVENKQIEHEKTSCGVVTVSVGVTAAVPDRAENEWELVDKADKALYRAKQKGKNRVETASV